MQVLLRSGQGLRVSFFLRSFRSFSLGSQSAFLPFRPYFRVCVLVAVFLSTQTSLYWAGAEDIVSNPAGPSCNYT